MLRVASRRWFFSGLFALVWALSGCGGKPEPYDPLRPVMGERGETLRDPEWGPNFPERSLLEYLDGTPPTTLLRAGSIFRAISSVENSDDDWVRTLMKAEIDSIENEIDQLDLGARAIMHRRLGGLTDDEITEFEKAAVLHARLGLAWMRTGKVNDRVKGAELLERAAYFDPDNPIYAILVAAYLDMAGFRSNAIRELDQFDEDQAPTDLVDLMRIRKHERLFKLLGFEEELLAALELSDRIALRNGGWNDAPAWLWLERARLHYFGRDRDRASDLAGRALERNSSAVDDTLTVVQSLLLQGVIDVRNLEFERAEERFARAMRIGEHSPQTLELVSWLRVPWDLLTEDEQLELDRSPSRRAWLQGFWRRGDPIWATPVLLENQVEYRRRVAESWFAFGGLDVGIPGPLTEPGRSVLRFGWPTDWRRTGSKDARTGQYDKLFNFSVHLSWEFYYRLLQDDDNVSEWFITFRDEDGMAHMAATDSLRPPAWPQKWFNNNFHGRAYEFDARMTRFREHNGRTRLMVSYDTVLPNYSVRFPLQGLEYEGVASVRTAVLRRVDDSWNVGWTGDVELDGEVTVNLDREFRRRSGVAVFNGIERGVYSVASMMHLRDTDGKIVAIGVDNGDGQSLPGFGFDDLEVSDMLLSSKIDGIVQEDIEREIVQGLKVYGPDPGKFTVVPRASRKFLPGESVAFYLEVYNLDLRDGVAECDLTTTLQKLNRKREVEFSVALTGSSSTLTRFGISQWNVARSIGLAELTPGSYNLSVEVFDRTGRRKVVRNAEFEVVDEEELIAHYRWRFLLRPGGSSASVFRGLELPSLDLEAP